MKVLQPPPDLPPYEAKHQCLKCTSYLLVEEADLFKTRPGLSGEGGTYYKCGHCGSNEAVYTVAKVIENRIPYGKLS